MSQTNTHTLTRHRDIQSWVSDHRGSPAIARIRNRFGEEKAQLMLRFVRSRAAKDEGVMSPCSWTAWLAELERQNLALRIDPAGECELVSRSAPH